MSTLRCVPICQGFSHFSSFLHHFVLAKLAKFSCQSIGLAASRFCRYCNFLASPSLNPFTLGVPPERIICYSHTFENNSGIKRKFTKYLKESCCLRVVVWLMINISPSNISQKMPLQVKYFQNCQACFGRSECEWVLMSPRRGCGVLESLQSLVRRVFIKMCHS